MLEDAEYFPASAKSTPGKERRPLGQVPKLVWKQRRSSFVINALKILVHIDPSFSKPVLFSKMTACPKAVPDHLLGRYVKVLISSFYKSTYSSVSLTKPSFF